MTLPRIHILHDAFLTTFLPSHALTHALLRVLNPRFIILDAGNPTKGFFDARRNVPSRTMILKTTSTAWFVTVAAMISPRNGVMAISAIPGSLIDPDVTFSHAFSLEVPNALAPSFIYQGTQNGGRKDFIVQIAETAQFCGLYDPAGEELNTTIWSYGQDDLITWPGKTFEVQRGERIRVRWENELPIGPHLLKSLEEVDCIDTNLHWAYSLPCCESLTALDNGVPTVVHLHGGHTDFQFDGNPEFFFSPGFVHLGPRFVNEWYKYDNIQPASTLWYHDHVIGKSYTPVLSLCHIFHNSSHAQLAFLCYSWVCKESPA
jgi:hypothetical protein